MTETSQKANRRAFLWVGERGLLAQEDQENQPQPSRHNLLWAGIHRALSK